MDTASVCDWLMLLFPSIVQKKNNNLIFLLSYVPNQLQFPLYPGVDFRIGFMRAGVPPTPPVMATYSYRQLRRIDTAVFSRDILSSRLYDGTTMDADEYAELFDEEVGRVLDSHAPLQTRRRRRGQHDIRHLSDDARKAKQARRRLERRYRRTGCESDRRAYKQATRAARDSIQRSRADNIKEELDAVAGDVKSAWGTAN